MNFCDSAELLREKLGHLPLVREDIEGSVRSRGCLLEDSFKPRKSSLGILKARVGLARCKRLLVSLKELTAELYTKLVDRTFTNGVKSEACLI